MLTDESSKQADPDKRIRGVPDIWTGPSARGVPLTTMELCRWAMLLVGGGMAFAVDEGWWVWLSIAGMLILILAMGMSQERWLTRERHQLITSALKRTAVTGRSRKKASQGTRTRRGANPSKRSLHGL